MIHQPNNTSFTHTISNYLACGTTFIATLSTQGKIQNQFYTHPDESLKGNTVAKKMRSQIHTAEVGMSSGRYFPQVL
jgi:hypothetical protein